MLGRLVERVAALEDAQRRRAAFWSELWAWAVLASAGLPLLGLPILLGLWRLLAIEIAAVGMIALAWWAVSWSMRRHGWTTPDEAPIRVRIVLMIPGIVGMGFLAWLLIPWRAVL